MTVRPSGKQPAAEWVYRGIWKALADWFRVPETPPDLPARPGETHASFHPAPGFLRLLKVEFWIICLVIDALIFLVWAILTSINPVVGIVLAIPALAIAIIPDVIAYIAIHLRYDTTWYVMSPRSLRVRRGIWTINEQTITFENVQDVRVTRGPLQQLFGIASVSVLTAGAGESGPHGSSSGNRAILEGVDNPAELLALIMERVRASRSAGLGDEEPETTAPRRAIGPASLTTAHLGLLREIRDGLRAAL